VGEVVRRLQSRDRQEICCSPQRPLHVKESKCEAWVEGKKVNGGKEERGGGRNIYKKQRRLRRKGKWYVEESKITMRVSISK
jgi:hypothetical protein